MTLRLARPEDEERLVEMASAFQAMSPYRSLEFSPAACSRLFKAYLEGDKTELIVIISEQDGEARGMVIGMCSSPLFSDDKMATEIAWWMDEDYRKTRDSLLLIEAYQEWARRVDAKVIQCAMLPDVTDLSRFYEKQGMTRAEVSYIRNS